MTWLVLVLRFPGVALFLCTYSRMKIRAPAMAAIAAPGDDMRLVFVLKGVSQVIQVQLIKKHLKTITTIKNQNKSNSKGITHTFCE